MVYRRHLFIPGKFCPIGNYCQKPLRQPHLNFRPSRPILQRSKGTGKDRDQLPALISKTEQKALQEKDPAIKAILYSMEADLYNEHYNANRYNINRRTNIQGFVPSDIGVDKQSVCRQDKGLVLKSITPTDVLQQNLQNYREILESGEDSPQLRPSLFDLLTLENQTLSLFSKTTQQQPLL